MTHADVLSRLESYYDAVPRRRANVEEVGPFTLFVARQGWPYYARPRLGEQPLTVSDADVHAVVERQRELGVPVAFEWVAQTSPGLVEPVARAGLHVESCPLLVLDGDPQGETSGARMIAPDDVHDLALSRAAISVGFAVGGTASGEQGVAARDAHVGEGFALVDDDTRRALASGSLRAAACYAVDEPSAGPVGGGAHNPVGGVSEIAGVAVLPAYRRHGLARAVSALLARDARDRGVELVFCSAQSDEVARVYERAGFRRVATACIASLPESADQAG